MVKIWELSIFLFIKMLKYLLYYVIIIILLTHIIKKFGIYKDWDSYKYVFYFIVIVIVFKGKQQAVMDFYITFLLWSIFKSSVCGMTVASNFLWVTQKPKCLIMAWIATVFKNIYYNWKCKHNWLPNLLREPILLFLSSFCK